ncbi:MAG: trifunctional transcriptional activator/DNA repair protein Ada/methylated-DNA--[protein]-cysteine S-methyltransferase [Acidobacteriota bacterium]
MTNLPPTQEMEKAYRRRDASYDGIFFLAVRTTGIFCRPSCAARKPLASNVEYFCTAREAIVAGYRPCKRCFPMQVDGTPPDWIAGLMHRVDTDPEARFRDTDLRALGLDPVRVRRFFRKHFGITFQAYSRGIRMSKALQQIRKGADLDDVTLGHGYESHSGFREAFSKTFGRPPGRSRHEGCVVTGWVESPLGPLVAAATDLGVCLLEFTERSMLEAQHAALRRLFDCAIVPGENDHLRQLKQELAAYFEGRLRRFTVPLVYPGTPFQQQVWEALLGIPYGETCSYETLALRLGMPGAQRAVGHANGQNRIAVVIPCHRVINKSGALGGYGGGLWRKKLLLDLEKGQGRLL